MEKRPNYFMLAGLFFVAFLVVQFTYIYGDSTWFKVFALIISGSFVVSGLSKNYEDAQNIK